MYDRALSLSGAEKKNFERIANWTQEYLNKQVRVKLADVERFFKRMVGALDLRSAVRQAKQSAIGGCAGLDREVCQVNGCSERTKRADRLLTRAAFRFGYYVAPQDIQELMKPLLSVADGRNDLLDPRGSGKRTKEDEEFLQQWQQKERFEQSSDNAVVAMVKTRALKVIDALLNLTYTVRLQVSLIGIVPQRAGESPRFSSICLPTSNHTIEVLS